MRAARLLIAAGALLAARAGSGAPASLAGAWLYGTGPEPKQSVVAVPPRCWHGGVDFTLADDGKTVTGTVRWLRAVGGAVPSVEHQESERLTGAREGDRLVLTGEHRVVDTPLRYGSMLGGASRTTTTPVRYELRLDRRTGHLVGTRNGEPLWLARFKMVPGNCGPPPP
jgi:hypothetical protein